MSEREIWFHTYITCRQVKDDHDTAVKNADAAVAKIKDLSVNR